MYTKIANNVKDFLTDRKGEEICWMVSQVCRSKKNLLYLLAAGLSGTAFLHAADIVKLDQPDLERGLRS
jgi:hypothetical protein